MPRTEPRGGPARLCSPGARRVLGPAYAVSEAGRGDQHHRAIGCLVDAEAGGVLRLVVDLAGGLEVGRVGRTGRPRVTMVELAEGRRAVAVRAEAGCLHGHDVPPDRGGRCVGPALGSRGSASASGPPSPRARSLSRGRTSPSRWSHDQRRPHQPHAAVRADPQPDRRAGHGQDPSARRPSAHGPQAGRGPRGRGQHGGARLPRARAARSHRDQGQGRQLRVRRRGGAEGQGAAATFVAEMRSLGISARESLALVRRVLEHPIRS